MGAPGKRALGLVTTLWALPVVFLVATSIAAEGVRGPAVLVPASLEHHVDTFNEHDEELYPQHISNERAWEFLRGNIPLFECPDEDFERTYYFRWWTYRKHIKNTTDGFVITEFLPQVGWSGKHNTISCPAGHHFYEGRWLRESRYLDDYSTFWFRKGGSVRSYSFWVANALWARYLVTLDKSHCLRRENGRIVPWIDENLNPYTGDWIARTRLKAWKDGTWDPRKGGRERGKDYNHSTYCDLIITGLVGLRPKPDDVIEVNPLVPDNTWDWFCLDNVLYHGKIVTIVWDKTGRKYNIGHGLQILADGEQIAQSDTLARLTGQLH